MLLYTTTIYTFNGIDIEHVLRRLIYAMLHFRIASSAVIILHKINNVTVIWFKLEIIIQQIQCIPLNREIFMRSKIVPLSKKSQFLKDENIPFCLFIVHFYNFCLPNQLKKDYIFWYFI